MNSQNHDHEVQLLQAWSLESELLQSVAQHCEVAENDWLNDEAEQDRIMTSIRELVDQWKQLQTNSTRLIESWNETGREFSRALREARDSNQAALRAAIDAVRAAEDRTKISRTKLLGEITETNQRRVMLRAYKPHRH